MVKILRKTQKRFASDANTTAQFGSTENGTPVFSKDLDVLQQLAAFSDGGWFDAALGGLRLPVLEEMNGLHRIFADQLGYLLQEGIPEFDIGTEYHQNSIVKKSGTYELYGSLIDTNIGNALPNQISDTNWQYLGSLTQATTSNIGLSSLPEMITVANNNVDPDHDIDSTAGVFNFDDGSGQARIIALIKQIDANFAEGNNAGGLDTGTVAADETYHVFAIYNPTTGNSDILFSANLGSPTLPSGYTKKKRIGSLLTDGSANIRRFKQNRKTFLLDQPLLIFSGAPASTAAQTISTESPSGLITCPIISVFFGATATDQIQRYLIFTRVDGQDIAPGTSQFDFRISQGAVEIEGISSNINFINTNISSEIRFRVNTVACDIQLLTKGWIDHNL